MSQFLPKGLRLPQYKEINASLLITKYAEVKTKAEKEDSKKIAEYSCKGKVRTQKVASYSFLPHAQFIAMKLGDRLIVDQSGGVQENSNFCLHPHFGTPTIPGSAVKGCARHYVWEQWDAAEGLEKEHLEQELNEIFGQFEEAGKIAFLPAMPYGSAPLEVDVLTCHHPDYYSPKEDKDQATDDENPIPVFFPVVKAGATFEFVVVPTVRGNDALAKKALAYLKSALEINGIGAKTAAGYGWFEENASAMESIKVHKEKSEQEQKKATLSPIERIQYELISIEGTGFGEEAIRILNDGSIDQQHALIRALGNEKKDEWKNWKKRAKTKKKLQERVEKAMRLANEFGEELI